MKMKVFVGGKVMGDDGMYWITSIECWVQIQRDLSGFSLAYNNAISQWAMQMIFGNKYNVNEVWVIIALINKKDKMIPFMLYVNWSSELCRLSVLRSRERQSWLVLKFTRLKLRISCLKASNIFVTLTTAFTDSSLNYFNCVAWGELFSTNRQRLVQCWHDWRYLVTRNILARWLACCLTCEVALAWIRGLKRCV